MPITADYHMHSDFSGDSSTPMETMILSAIQRGLTDICFTEHYDLDYPISDETPPGIFLVDTDAYHDRLVHLQEKYADKLKIRFGIELGLQPQLKDTLARYTDAYAFDFIIGSSHTCYGQDPYYFHFYNGRSEEEAYRLYFTSIIENLRIFDNFDVYGHLDYVVRYGPNKDRQYTYERYSDLLDTILSLLLEKGKGLEINTAGIKYGLTELHPSCAILKKYKSMGGEIITIGSDAHDHTRPGADFDKAAEVLSACGFRYYTVFDKRTPRFIRL